MPKIQDKMKKSSNNNNNVYKGSRKDKQPKVQRGKNRWNDEETEHGFEHAH